jgi:hypothetical protein
MSFLRKIWWATRVAFFTLVGWLAVQGVALAAAPKQPQSNVPEIKSNVYVAAYIVVLIGVASGMLFVCRPSNRRDRAKPEQFSDSKNAKK